MSPRKYSQQSHERERARERERHRGEIQLKLGISKPCGHYLGGSFKQIKFNIPLKNFHKDII